ncbi:APC family permease [Hymenobacter crusticola]|uniref:Amino acid permease n=1 Tax=Hymenobacter crusticola TaxID=1770526 RepID=A0A243W8E6_9BACT|nr:amino acid permease [Hymenobacter crusticola]OUJ71592.1 amino acid permease [Hymenobacter crusticola]
MTQLATPVYRIGLYTGIAIVVANMVGTGVFTSLGFQVIGIQSGFALLMLWAVGGLIALCGALSYGELAAALPRSGGEYHYLSYIYHPIVGFLSGWVSATVGFAAPTALAAIALGKYAVSVWPGLNAQVLSILVVAALTLIHATNSRAGSRFQVVITLVKVILLVAFIGAGLVWATPQSLTFTPQRVDWQQIISPAFAVSLVYVSYAYSGWNAAVYLAGEVEQPQRNLPRILVSGTAVVLLLYVGLNFVFLYATPLSKLAGQVEIGYLAAIQIFGFAVGRLMGAVIAVLLISTVSSMVFAGPRIVQVMGEDLPALRSLAVVSRQGIPVRAMLLQAFLTLFFIVTSTFEDVLLYAGFVLSLFTFLTVLGLFVLRWRQPHLPRPYRTWAYPVPPLLFLALSGWTLVFILRDKPLESFLGLLTVLLGAGIYKLGSRQVSKE